MTPAAHEVYLNKLTSLIINPNTILLGDVNYPSINWETYTTSYKYAQRSMDFINASSPDQLVEVPTRGSKILDLVLSNITTLCQKLSIIMSLLRSDHPSVTLTMRVKPDLPQNTSVFRDSSKANLIQLTDDLMKCKHLPHLDDPILHTATFEDNFYAHLKACIRASVPIRQIQC